MYQNDVTLESISQFTKSRPCFDGVVYRDIDA